jgi:PilZ domain-containing protein
MHGRNGSRQMNGTEVFMARAEVSETIPDQPPAKIAIQGHYSLPYWYDPQGKPRTFACRTISVSPLQMTLAVAVAGKVGNRIISCFPDLGNMDGSITDTFAGGFVFEPDLTDIERERMASKLVWLEKKQRDPAVRDARRHDRFIPANPHSTLTLADGSTRSCFVIDMSVTGVAVSAAVQPPIGAALAIGACVGRVVRLLPEGFAIQFAETQRRHDLNRLLLRVDPAPVSRTGS